jgi:hypothetical protein
MAVGTLNDARKRIVEMEVDGGAGLLLRVFVRAQL